MINYGEMAKIYDSKYTSAMCRKENAKIRRLIRKWYGPGRKILDVGCGTGLAVDLVPEIRKADYTGYDISAKMVNVAGDKHPGYFFWPRKAERITEKEEFDIALCLFSIPYIGKHAVKPIYEALKPGGVVICVCYDKPYLNPSSVYGGHKLKYLLTVAWRVRAVLNKFGGLFTKTSETPLAGERAYKVIVYKKGGRTHGKHERPQIQRGY